MNLSISNIGWQAKDDAVVYELMKKYGYSGLEIAPTRIFPENPYKQVDEAKEWADKLKAQYGFAVSSMQSIWYGRQEKIFGTAADRMILLDYTKQAIDFAESIDCKNLVFGCPRNRMLPAGVDAKSAVAFFKELGDYAMQHHTVIGVEANPPIYNTNYINDTISAFRLIEEVHSEGFKLNLDVGTIIQNGESVDELIGKVRSVNHVHISEPELKLIHERQLHQRLRIILEKENYRGFVSIEMGRTDDLQSVEKTMQYIKEVFE